MTDPQTDRELIAEAREFFGYAYECGDFDDWERAARMVPVLDRILEALTAANRLIPEGADRITRAGHAAMTSNETKENKTA